jgi:hypothetical protein
VRVASLTVEKLSRALTEAIAASSRGRELPVVVELYEGTGTRRPLIVTGISFTGAGNVPDAVTMTVTPGS